MRAHSFTSRPVNTDGEFVDNHEVWTIHGAAFDNTIQAGRSVLIRYRFRIPKDVKGPVALTAKVNYQHFRDSYLNNVFGKNHPKYPTAVLASRVRTLNIGDNAPAAPDPSDNQDWMRWNNLGIAYLDAFQYAEAVNAFGEVVRLRPDYADAYTNIALTEIQWEKYDSARMSIDKALALNPDNPRALYYASQLERRAGNTSAELADLQEVVQQFPQSRDARRELGIAYYRQGDYEHATEQFEALQAIDPDDLAAHYNLSILYHRMGKTKEAEAQQALFVTEKINSDARTLAQHFRVNHSAVSMESVPWHVHSDSSTDSSDSPQNPSGATSGAGQQ